MAFPRCPVVSDSPTARALFDLGAGWAVDPIRPRIADSVLTHWDRLLDDWLNDPIVPLLVRKFKDNRGSVITGSNGRRIVPTDNSPAQWVFAVAYDGLRPQLTEIVPLLEAGKLPVAMAFRKAEKFSVVYDGVRGKCPGTADGWKLAHLEQIGMKSRNAINSAAPEVLERHFRLFLSPRNMMVIPAAWSGLGEVPEFLRGFKSTAG